MCNATIENHAHVDKREPGDQNHFASVIQLIVKTFYFGEHRVQLNEDSLIHFFYPEILIYKINNTNELMIGIYSYYFHHFLKIVEFNIWVFFMCVCVCVCVLNFV